MLFDDHCASEKDNFLGRRTLLSFELQFGQEDPLGERNYSFGWDKKLQQKVCYALIVSTMCVEFGVGLCVYTNVPWLSNLCRSL